MILFFYFDNLGRQYLTENPDKAESRLQKSGISNIEIREYGENPDYTEYTVFTNLDKLIRVCKNA